jgi:hypothetical protein
MYIPKSVRIKKSKWKIILSDIKLDTKMYNGLCIHQSREILIDPNLPRNEIEETFIHELLHACFPDGICSYKKEEMIVTELARHLQPVWKQLLRQYKRYCTTNKKKKTN